MRSLSLIVDIIAGIILLGLIFFPKGPLPILLSFLAVAIGCIVLSFYLRRRNRQ
jgi:hypothetical protein